MDVIEEKYIWSSFGRIIKKTLRVSAYNCNPQNWEEERVSLKENCSKNT